MHHFAAPPSRAVKIRDETEATLTDRVAAWAVRSGRTRSTIAVTLTSILLSVGASLVAIVFFPYEGQTRGHEIWAIVLSTLIPAIVAPLVSSMLFKLMIELSEANEALRRAAITDPLTGVLNRRGFFAAAEAIDRDRTMRVGIGDLDNFKAVNDALGHATGDQALLTVASRIAALASPGFVGRIGGDEFAFVTWRTDGLEAAVEASRSVSFDSADSANQIAVSIGLADWRTAEPVEAALSAADEQLYRAKAVARHRTRPRSDDQRP